MLLFQYLYYTLRISLFFFAEEIDRCSYHHRTEYLPYRIIKRYTGNTCLQFVLYMGIEGLITSFYQIKHRDMGNRYTLGLACCTRCVHNISITALFFVYRFTSYRRDCRSINGKPLNLRILRNRSITICDYQIKLTVIYDIPYTFCRVFRIHRNIGKACLPDAKNHRNSILGT